MKYAFLLLVRIVNQSSKTNLNRRDSGQSKKLSNNVVILTNNDVILSNNVVILSNNDVILTLPVTFGSPRSELRHAFPVPSSAAI